MKIIRLDIEYEGTDFAGWAKQPNLPSIEASLENVLSQILRQPVTLSVAGRTDAGVHARGQVASFQLAGGADMAGPAGNTVGAGEKENGGESHTGIDPGKLRHAANRMLPPAIVITRVSEQPPGFDARHSAVARAYSYQVLNRPWPSPFLHRHVHYHPLRLDDELLGQAASLIFGRHDFTAFTPTETEHASFEREITLSEWSRDGNLLVYRIAASGFLRNMVRVLAGTMLEIGRGYRPLSELPDLLAGAGRPAAGKTAPPQGLCLESVEYAPADEKP
jgi:tRNA pseudouridine38-40 synthase